MDGRRVPAGLLPPALSRLKDRATEWVAHRRYLSGGRVPWTPGYHVEKRRVVERALDDAALLARFRAGEPLPAGFGAGVGERAVEYPWTFARLGAGPGLVLDAGSALNHAHLLARPPLSEKKLHVVTLAPEAECHWRRGVSYFYHDLRRLPVRDALYDAVVCVSTLEHVGCDNTGYTGDARHEEDQPDDFERAMGEMSRVLKPGGELLLTVPYGRYRHLGRLQQFDRALLTRAERAFGKAAALDETFYRYAPDGWRLATEAECADAEYAEWGMLPQAERRRAAPPADGAAAARAVACVRLVKA